MTGVQLCLTPGHVYNVLRTKEYFESDGALMDAFMKSTIQSNNLRKRKNNDTRNTEDITIKGKLLKGKDMLHWKSAPCL